MPPINMTNVLRTINLRDEKSHRWTIYACLGLLVLLAIAVRISLVNYQTGDYLTIGSWYDFIKAHGLHSFKYEFSNYNPPFTYALYIATLLPLSKIVAIKWILAIFDLILAVSVFLVVRIFRPKGYIAFIAGLVSLFAPTVLLTGVFASQFDQLYTAFMLFSFFFGLRSMSRLAWICMGLAIAIKLQAFFLLPLLGVMSFKQIKWYDIIWGFAAFLVVSLPPMIVGRSFSSIISLYPDQTGEFNHYLTANAPNLYQWVPANGVFNYLDGMGLSLAAAVAVLVVLISLIYKKFSPKELLVALVLVLYAIPFFLPAMHERYFFPAGIASIVLAFAYPTRLNAGLAVLAQVITFFSYCPFLFATAPIPFSILSIFTLAIICAMVAQFLELPRLVTNNKTRTT